ncbi:formin-like protein CG32138 [Limulus polyphemus]|uniref:Formin-like protein CG32138 n=1 Tax=Limulus polyphemus TaxID=6850 RepID=A0ABM1SJS5_LIMPO|nr:formin-like protein CG32138 [Limulus polyphemus]
MGNSESSHSTGVNHSHMASLRKHSGVDGIKMPMPERNELERRFTLVLASMDLPPDKAKLLKQYDDGKKWDMICDQEKVMAKESPSFYLRKLKTYLDPKASRSSRKRKFLGDASSTQVLRDLEISLRTNHIEWVREFLNEENKGLDVLIDYLAFRLVILKHEQTLRDTHVHDDHDHENGTISNGYPASHHFILEFDTPKIRRASRHIAKLNMGEAKDDIHVCIMCLRAIMNNKYGFNMVIEHTEAINCIALSLNHKSLRTKALVLELLAAICLVKGGHEIILNAFDQFKEVCVERRRFETLMEYFMNYEVFNIDFMVACMQFINIVVHSVEDMNFRIHLQYEFTQLGLDDYLEKLRQSESEELQVQISAYLDNVFDVAALMEDSETKITALEQVAELEEQLSRANEEYFEMENEMNARLVELETELECVRKEKNDLQELHQQTDEELNTLRQAVRQKEEESLQRQSILESKIEELEIYQKSLPRGTSLSEISGGVSEGIIVPKPQPPPPPLLLLLHHQHHHVLLHHSTRSCFLHTLKRLLFHIYNRYVFAGHSFHLFLFLAAMTIKRRYQTKYKLPTLNWTALKPNQVKGTVFSELDEDKLYRVINFSDFEEHFKLSQQGGFTDRTDDINCSKRFKVPEKITMLEHNRLRNVAISLRKLELPSETVVRALNALDLKMLIQEYVEILLRMVPNEKEVKAYREYERQRRPTDALTDEDKFLLSLSKVERLSQKLNIMSYIASFGENIQLITPQVHSIITASRSIKNSKKIRKILEIILAFGNYMNGAKRGPAYGFKLQILDMLGDTKSADRKISLLHYIVDTVQNHFPDVVSFECELRFVEKAAGVSLENIQIDVSELEKGLELCKKELTLRGDAKDAAVLREFLLNNEEKLRKLKANTKTAQEAYSDCVEYFGESARTVAANTFFTFFVRFSKAFKQAQQENEQRRKQEQAAKEAKQNPPEKVKNKNYVNARKNTQDAVINELKNKARQVKEKRLLKQDEVYNGALEDILLALAKDGMKLLTLEFS